MYRHSCRPRRRTVLGSGKKYRQRIAFTHIANRVVTITMPTANGSAWLTTESTSRTSTTYSSSATAIRLTATPIRARGSFITHPARTYPGRAASGAGHLVDDDAAVAIGYVEPIADHPVQLRQAGGGVVCPFEAADDDEPHAVLLDDAPGDGRVRRVVEPLDVPQPLVDALGIAGPLLLLVPVPTQDGRQPGVDREPRAPVVERRVALHDDRRAVHAAEHPADCPPVRRQVQVAVTVPVARPGHERHAVEGWRQRFESVRHLGARGQDRVDRAGQPEHHHRRRPAVAQELARHLGRDQIVAGPARSCWSDRRGRHASPRSHRGPTA